MHGHLAPWPSDDIMVDRWVPCWVELKSLMESSMLRLMSEHFRFRQPYCEGVVGSCPNGSCYFGSFCLTFGHSLLCKEFLHLYVIRNMGQCAYSKCKVASLFYGSCYFGSFCLTFGHSLLCKEFLRLYVIRNMGQFTYSKCEVASLF